MYKNIALTLLISFTFIACSSKESAQLPAKCYEVPKSGMCKAMFTKYYFDSKESKCKAFIWGGCGGNIPFKTLKECEKECKK